MVFKRAEVMLVTARFVLVAVPETVSPPAAVPLPIVEDADEMIPPVKDNRVVVELPTNG